MAILFMDSFDHYATADLLEKWTQICTQITGTPVQPAIGAYGRNSTQGLRLSVTPNQGYTGLPVAVTLAPSGATFIFGAAVKYSAFATMPVAANPAIAYGQGGGGSNWLVCLRDTNTTQVWFRVNQNGTISCLLGDGASCTVLGTSSTSLQAGVFHYVEIKVLIHGSAGTVTIRQDGKVGLNLSGQVTQFSGAAQWNDVRVGYLATSSTPVTLDIEDCAIMDGSGSVNNDFLGDVTISALYPSGAGTTSGWTPSAGSNYACVDEALVNDDTDYVATTTINAKDTYAMQDTASGADIRAVQIVSAQRKGTEGPGRMKHVVRSGGTDYDQAEQGLGGTSYAFLRSILETDPATAAAWSESGWNAVEVGVKKTG